LTEITSETQRSLRQFRKLLKFRPREAVAACLDADDASSLITGWELSRLVAWAFFDQQTRMEVHGDQPKTETSTDWKRRKPTKRPFRPSYGYKAGQLY
jgi:hypothetical protein